MNKVRELKSVTKEIIADRSIVAIGGVHSHNVPMALVRQIIRNETKNLTLLGSISVGLPIDLLVGTGCVDRVLAPYVGFEMWGLAPNFRRAVEKGEIEAPDLCEAFPIYSLRAASNGLPFHPFPPGIHEFTDIHRDNKYYMTVKDPFTQEEVYAVQALKPDVAIIHVQKASSDGNCIHTGSVVADRLMATAAKYVIITCDELVDKEEIKRNPSAVTIPGFFVDMVIHLKYGTHPTSSHGVHLYDREEILSYLDACKTPETYKQYLDTKILISEEQYVQNIKEITRDREIIPLDTPYTTAELITTVFSRDIKDNEFGICGAVSDIPMVAMQMAERIHAPGLRWIAGGSGYVNPRDYLVPSSTDYHMSRGAEARLSMDEVIPIEMEEIDFFFAGGLQIDSRGNTNLAGIPSENGWKLRGPGSVGLAFLSRAKRSYLYTIGHNIRSVVDKVSYISGAGHPEGGNPFGGGPTLFVTNLCVFRWNKKGDQWELTSVHPDVTVTDVKNNTGFAFIIQTDEIPITKVPSGEELAILREIDKYGYLRGKKA